MAAEAAVSFAVETLGKLLIEKAVFLSSVKGEVEWLREELKSMQCFLKDAAKKQSESKSIRKWISDIREVANDAEDAIEIFVLKVQRKKLTKRYGCFPNHLYHLNKVGKQIKSIRQKLIDIQDRRVTYGIQIDEKEEASTRTKRQEEIETRRRLDYWKPDQQQLVVGLEEDVKILLREAVFKERKGLSVSALLGMGGTGKSTLASKLYNHAEVAGRFEFRGWVVVSSEFNPEDVMKQILLKLGIRGDELKPLLERLGSIEDKVSRQEEVKKELHQRLTRIRYFIVLDDVWEPHHWESLSTAFPADGDKGSRLLLTSRNPVITRKSGYVHNMKLLSDTESWDLFIRKALGGNSSSDECPEELKEVGEEIVKKCGGLPLAISVVGGLLAKKTPSNREWEKVLKEMKYHLDIYTSSGDLDTITAILELSYQNLTPELKACFLSFGFFKEDAVINAEELVHIWVAQGLVVQEVEREEVARNYLDGLISRNMVQVKEMRYGEVKACNMHDLLRDLSIRKAKEEIDFEVVREEQNSSDQSLPKPRHRSIYFNETSFVYSTNRNQHLRSLFVHYYMDSSIYSSGGPLSYWKSFELLRLLDFGSTKFSVFPKGIGELTGLRYLKMRFTGYARLPRSWAKLKNLEVLDLRCRHDSGSITIDKVLVKMESLRHLYADVESSKVGLGNMRKLETLHFIRLESCSDVWKIQGMSGDSKLGIRMFPSGETTSSLLTCLSSLENLFHLTLFYLESQTNLEGLSSLHRLTRLKLDGGYDRFRYRKLPAYFPPNLSHLTLSGMLLEEDSMAVLEKLAKLIYLKLNRVVSTKQTMVITSGGFPSLKVLHIQNIERIWEITFDESALNIEHIWTMKIEESAMPELNQFIIRRCPDFDVENLPERIESAILWDDI